MIINRKQKTDEEYVEKIRKRDQTFRRIRWLWVVLLVGFIFCLVNFADIFRRISTDMPIDQSLAYTGLLLGIMFGFIMTIIGAQAGLCIKNWLDARHGFRTERLMLKYHDELKEKTSNKSTEAPNIHEPHIKI